MGTPADHYSVSSRKWDGILRSPEYDTKGIQVRKVGQNGCIWFTQREYFLGQALSGEYVALKENHQKDLEVHYGPINLGKLKLGEGLEKPKRISKKIVRRG